MHSINFLQYSCSFKFNNHICYFLRNILITRNPVSKQSFSSQMQITECYIYSYIFFVTLVIKNTTSHLSKTMTSNYKHIIVQCQCISINTRYNQSVHVAITHYCVYWIKLYFVPIFDVIVTVFVLFTVSTLGILGSIYRNTSSSLLYS